MLFVHPIGLQAVHGDPAGGGGVGQNGAFGRIFGREARQLRAAARRGHPTRVDDRHQHRRLLLELPDQLIQAQGVDPNILLGEVRDGRRQVHRHQVIGVVEFEAVAGEVHQAQLGAARHVLERRDVLAHASQVAIDAQHHVVAAVIEGPGHQCCVPGRGGQGVAMPVGAIAEDQGIAGGAVCAGELGPAVWQGFRVGPVDDWVGNWSGLRGRRGVVEGGGRGRRLGRAGGRGEGQRGDCA